MIRLNSNPAVGVFRVNLGLSLTDSQTSPSQMLLVADPARAGPASPWPLHLQMLEDRTPQPVWLRGSVVPSRFYRTVQSIGAAPCSSSSWFTRLKGLDPKKPACADIGEGWAEATTGTQA